jgi:hypothetical protein
VQPESEYSSATDDMVEADRIGGEESIVNCYQSKGVLAK